MTDVEIPDFMRRAMEAQGKITPDEVAARIAEDSEAVSQMPISDSGRESAAVSEQLPLLSAEEAALARDEAMARVERNADPELRISYERLAIRLAHTRPEFTTDALEALAEAEGLPVPHEKRVLGPWMLGLAKRGIIERTDRTVLSVRKSNHRRPIRVWSSLVYYGHERD